jgi:hypothetical protein
MSVSKIMDVRGISVISRCTELLNLDESFDVAIDFSSRRTGELSQALDILGGRVGFWVFVSSHAVYEVAANRSIEEVRNSLN